MLNAHSNTPDMATTIIRLTPAKIFSLIALATIFLAKPGQSSPSQLPWKRPCSAGLSRNNDVEIPTNDLEERQSRPEREKEDMVLSLRRTLKVAKKLQKFIVNEQLRNRHLVKSCKGKKSLRGIPQIRSSKAFVKRNKWYQVLPDDFRRLSVLSAFVHQASQEKFNSYRKKLEKLLNHLLKSSCRVYGMAHFHEQSLTDEVPPSIVLEVYKNFQEQASMDIRNCLIVKDTSKILTDMIRTYR